MANYDSTYTGAQIDTALGYANTLNTHKIPATTAAIFYQDTAPTTWTIDNTLDDKLLFITKGSAASGETGGGEHSTGTWTYTGFTKDAHTHSVTIPISGYGGSAVGVQAGYIQTDNPGNIYHATTQPVATSGAQSDAGITHDGTDRPAAYCAIICTKDAYS